MLHMMFRSIGERLRSCQSFEIFKGIWNLFSQICNLMVSLLFVKQDTTVTYLTSVEKCSRVG